MPSPSSPLRMLAVLGAAVLFSACGEPECPHGYQKIKSACFRVDGGERDLDSDEAGVTATMEAGASAVSEGGIPSPSIDSGVQASQSADSSTSPSTTSDASSMPSVASDAASTPAPSQPTADGGAQPATPECDATHSCAPGFVCSAMKCVSACTQTQCDPNATCSLVNNTATCTCNRGFIAMAGSGGAVTCLRDVACEELGCDTNASCVAGSDQLRNCVCKNGYTGTGKTCTAVSCPAPTIENGTVSALEGSTFGHTATYRCNTGYEQASGGSWTRTCGANMQWSGTQPTCRLVNCGSPPAASANGSVSAPQTTYGAQARYTCAAGYAPRESTITCAASGSWSGAAPTCRATCGNGVRDANEDCDPMIAGTSIWNCDPVTCRSRTAYAPCAGNTGSGTSLQGIGCAGGDICFGFCTRFCSAGCSSAPPESRLIGGCLPNAMACSVYGCQSHTDCPPGTFCGVSNACQPCDPQSPTAQCPGSTVCRALTGSFGGLGRCAP